jgi:hypothetical protein
VNLMMNFIIRKEKLEENKMGQKQPNKEGLM